MIVERIDIDTLETMDDPLPHHVRGLSYTRSGYGSRIPTVRKVRLPGSPRWRRVYCFSWSNLGTHYVLRGKDWIVLY